MDKWGAVASWQSLLSAGRDMQRMQGHEIALFAIEGQPYAIEDSCPHAGASLCRGQVSGHSVQCPAHGLSFDLSTGDLNGRQNGLRTRVYPVRAEGDDVLVQLPV